MFSELNVDHDVVMLFIFYFWFKYCSVVVNCIDIIQRWLATIFFQFVNTITDIKFVFHFDLFLWLNSYSSRKNLLDREYIRFWFFFQILAIAHFLIFQINKYRPSRLLSAKQEKVKIFLNTDTLLYQEQEYTCFNR